MTTMSRALLLDLSAVIAFVVLTAAGCAPAFQDARMLGPGHLEITPSVSPIFGSNRDETEWIGTESGVQALVGVHDRVDLGVGYHRANLDDADDGVNLFGFGAKFGLSKDRMAFALPVTFAAGSGIETSETVTVQPTMLFTLPVKQRLDLNPSAKVLIPFCEGCEVLVGGGLGLGIATTAGRGVVVRPEVSLLFNPGESGVVWSVGVGVSLRSALP